MGLFAKKNKVPEPYIVKDKPLICHHCGNHLFYLRGANILFYRQFRQQPSRMLHLFRMQPYALVQYQ
jgi:hypothetical protein